MDLKGKSPTETISVKTNRKRKAEEAERSSMEDLNQDVLEKVLSWLPTSSFLRLTSVSKRWSSAASSAAFKLACAAVPSRDPWFLMLSDDRTRRQPIAFDTSEHRWIKLPLLPQHSMPVASSSSGGLVCLRDPLGNFAISNPVTGFSAQVPPLHGLQDLHAVAMIKSSNKLALVFGGEPSLCFKLYDPRTNAWEPDVALARYDTTTAGERKLEDENSAVVYFLSKTGDVVSVSTEVMQRSPCKQYSCVAVTDGGGEDSVFFLSSAGRVTACNLTRRRVREYPRLMAAAKEYSVDLVGCGGRVLVVLLSEFCESASVRVWEYEEAAEEWRQVAVMPAAMSHVWYGKKADVNCVGGGDGRIMVCLSSSEGFGCVLCDLERNVWTELPKCCVDGSELGFVSAFSFQPRIEACV